MAVKINVFKEEIIEDFKNGASLNILAQKFGCSYGTMCDFLEKNFENYKKIAKDHQQETGRKVGQLPKSEKHREESRKNITKYNKSEKGREISRKNVKKATEAAAKTRISKQEILFSLILANENLQFTHQFLICYTDINDKKRFWSVDLFIFPNIIVQIDGIYWHCRHKKGTLLKDWYQNRELKKQGYKVIRFWDFEINNDIEKCIKKVKNLTYLFC